jgi:hypothetical protein
VTLEIKKPEVEAPLQKLQKKGENLDELLFQSLNTLKSNPEKTVKYQRPPGKKSLAQIFAESPFRGLDLNFERSHHMLRPVDL